MTGLEHKSAPDAPGHRLPRIALMGEFSAGKSTLANLMIGAEYLPVQVVATQLPPVWITRGDAAPVLVGLDGSETPCDLSRPQDIPLEDTAYIRVCRDEEILKHCDIIDLPGISDPNMAADVWERMLPLADGVVWCSPATQAWRQSEAAVWEAVSSEKYAHSILLLTRGDMLVRDRDRERVLRRVRSETRDLFSETLMVSLVLARDCGDDEEMWEQSGAEPFVTRFLDIVETLKEVAASRGETDSGTVLPVASPEEDSVLPDNAPAKPVPEPVADGTVMPRRPVARGRRGAGTPRPLAEDEDEQSFAPKFS